MISGVSVANLLLSYSSGFLLISNIFVILLHKQKISILRYSVGTTTSNNLQTGQNISEKCNKCEYKIIT